jgi:hypothetical protein
VRVLLDTCALLWLVGDPARLSARARAVLENTETEPYVSAPPTRPSMHGTSGDTRAYVCGCGDGIQGNANNFQRPE